MYFAWGLEDFIPSYTVNLQVMESSDTAINVDLDEAYRMYFHYHTLKTITREHLSEGEINDINKFEIAPRELIKRLHVYLDISYDEFLQVYRNGRFLSVVDFYQDKARQNEINLSDVDIAKILNIINNSVDAVHVLTDYSVNKELWLAGFAWETQILPILESTNESKTNPLSPGSSKTISRRQLLLGRL